VVQILHSGVAQLVSQRPQSQKRKMLPQWSPRPPWARSPFTEMLRAPCQLGLFNAILYVMNPKVKEAWRQVRPIIVLHR
jgi:hypothetical protein